MRFIKNLIYRFRAEFTTEKLVKMGMKVGKNFSRLNGVILDPSHCWLIEIGDNVTIAPRVHILCHDASSKTFLGYTKIGRVKIGDNVFIGAESVILPNIKIGNNVIVGANSTVTKDVPAGMVVAGNPARVICTIDEYILKQKEQMKNSPIYDENYTLRGDITNEKKQEQRDALENSWGYVD